MPRKDLLAATAAACIAKNIVATDPRSLKPGELVRLLNSTPAGPVTDARRLAAHREAAGLRIGDGKRVDLFRYAAWLFARTREPSSPPARSADLAASSENASPDLGAADSYERKKERERARNAAHSATGRDISPLPAVADPERKAAALGSLRLFCETYFPDRFRLAWSDDHLKVIARAEIAIVKGGLFALAMPRGSGKTTLVEVLCLWATLTGRGKFIVLIGASEAHAIEMLDSLKTELETNELLAADFPEVCYPIARLEGLANRAAGQIAGGERTHIGWTGKGVVLPTIAGSPASAAVIRTAGITGRIRGLKFTRPDGKSVRPDFVVVDDPQTDASARSPSQCDTRKRVLAGAILGLAGPGQKIAGIMPCTVVRPGDMADEILDREQHPEWQGERMRLVYRWPWEPNPANPKDGEPAGVSRRSEAKRLWEEYERLRIDELRAGGDGTRATKFYKKNRRAMDAGAIVAWPARHNADELSALQHAINLRIADAAAFAAEYQNEPEKEDANDAGGPSAEEICQRTNGHARGEVPLGTTHVTAFIDVQGKLLYWLAAAYRDDFTGCVIDYNAWPDQGKAYYTLREAKKTMQTVTGAPSIESAIFAALERLVAELCEREWRGENGSVHRIEKLLIDANWGESTDTVYDFCRQSKHAAVLMPSHGRSIGAANLPMSEWKKSTGDRLGFHWYSPRPRGKRTIRHVTLDTNHWKTFLRNRLSTSPADAGALTLFGDAAGATRSGADHRLLADHLTSEYPVPVIGRGRKVDEWKEKPDHPDNHWLDCAVGCQAGAAMLGCTLLSGEASAMPREKKPIKFSELQKAKRGGG